MKPEKPFESEEWVEAGIGGKAEKPQVCMTCNTCNTCSFFMRDCHCCREGKAMESSL